MSSFLSGNWVTARVVGRRRRSWRQWTKTAVLTMAVAVASVAIGFPFYYMASTSLKTAAETFSVPMVLYPSKLQWVNYVEVWNMLPFGRFTMNSLIYTGLITVGEFVLGLTCGYAFGRLRFPKKDVIFFIVLLTYLIPGHIILIPRFIMLHKLGWINTYQGLIVPQLSSAFSTFMLREHFMTLPDELFDAAKIDGAGRLRQLFQVAMPMSKPITITLLLLGVSAHWNAYMWPLIVTNSRNMRTLPIGVQEIRSMLEYPEWQLINAGATLVVLPLVVLFLLGQKQFIEGMTQGAVKG